MARIRSIHPGIWTDAKFATLSNAAQILWIGIWTECDDQGVFIWEPIQLKMRIRPATTEPVEPLLEELSISDCIRSYEVGGRQYGAVRNFCRFQRPKKPSHVHPVPHQFRTYLGLTDESSEPSEHNEPPSSPPVPNSTPNEQTEVPHQFRTGAEKLNQMEEGGGRGEEEEELAHANSSAREPILVSETKTRKKRTSFGDDDSFIAFWEAYPRKDNKGYARKAWISAISKAEPSVIIAGCRGYPFNENPRFVPLPTTWLNGERWLAASEGDGLDPVLRAAGVTADMVLGEAAEGRRAVLSPSWDGSGGGVRRTATDPIPGLANGGGR